MQFDERLEEDDADDEYDRSQHPKPEQAPERRGKQQIRPLKPVQRWGREGRGGQGFFRADRGTSGCGDRGVKIWEQNSDGDTL